MNTLTLVIGGRSFALAVQPGDEEHVRALGEQIDTKFQQLAPRYSQNLLFATLQLADDFHRAKVAWEQGREEHQAAANRAAEAERLAMLATGKTDALKARVTELETELSNLQRSIQQESNKYNDLIADNERYKVAVMDADVENSRLQGELATVRRERDAFERSLSEASAKGGGDAHGPGAVSAIPLDPDLAPALERFAELLENCVTKLERQPRAS
ncbi:cell division protein ZapA [Parerythrobacter aurantius]|uniref:cell division protein ZapA n=1 Tax=Parerythrobacter aurantius TaxID=3127706 RepID=UPI0032450E58